VTEPFNNSFVHLQHILLKYKQGDILSSSSTYTATLTSVKHLNRTEQNITVSAVTLGRLTATKVREKANRG
jgi:hypothetical protein